MNTTQINRLATIAYLAEKMPQGKTMGRTVLMKLIYLSQTLKDVPLEYHFSLYTYGPFDSDVLSDLAQTQEQGGVSSNIIYHANGYGYEIQAGSKSEEVKEQASSFLQQQREALNEIMDNFGQLSPAMLELTSTVVFASQEDGGKTLKDKLFTKVREIEPRFSEEEIKRQYQFLTEKCYIES